MAAAPRKGRQERASFCGRQRQQAIAALASLHFSQRGCDVGGSFAIAIDELLSYHCSKLRYSAKNFAG